MNAPALSPAPRRQVPGTACTALSALVTLAALAGLGAVATGAPAPARAPAGARAAAQARQALPDSVLVRIDGREDVTRRRFERAVRLLGGRPDSLTPPDRDRFLDMVLEQRLLAARARRDPRPWTRQDSLQYQAERDNVLLRAAISDRFTAVEERRRALGQPDLDEAAMGMAARESLMVDLKPVWDTEALRSIGSRFAELPQTTPDMSPREQIRIAGLSPNVPAAETLRVLVRTTIGPFTVADLLADWRRLSSIYKPHVRDDEAVKALVQNGLFERVIRKAAQDPALAERPIVRSVLEDRMEYHSVSTFLQRDVLSSIPTDSLTLLRHYRAHTADFDRPASASLVILTLETQHAADSLARLFAVPGEAESLAFRAQRNGVRYTLLVTEVGDTALFRRVKATGAGGVGGPEQVEGGWRVFKVLSLEPRRTQPFADVRHDVERAWNEFESERRIRKLLDTLKREARIERNTRALLAVATAPAPRVAPPPRRAR